MTLTNISWKGSDTASSEFILSKRIEKFRTFLPDLKEFKILDYGCGEGSYSNLLSTMAETVVGIDLDISKIKSAKDKYKGENLIFLELKNNLLTFSDGFFDLVFLNEVIEHIVDFEPTFYEITRVLKKSGICVIYAPNKLYPFDQHGFEIHGKKFGNKLPFITWLPRKFTAKHVNFYARQYTLRDFKEIAKKYEYSIVHHDYLAPPCDGIKSKNYSLGSALRFLFNLTEKIPVLKLFMMSHLVILRKK